MVEALDASSKFFVSADLMKRAQLQLEVDALRNSFPKFAAAAWQEIDSAPLKKGWFLELLWEELEKWALGVPSHRKTIIAVPPGSAKSISASVLLPAWLWARDPTTSFLTYASTQDLAVRDNLRMRDLVTSEWFQDRFCQTWILHPSQSQKKRFRNTAMGERYGIGGMSRPTGWRGDNIIIDDPVDANPRKPPRPEDLEAAYNAVQYLFRTRINDPLTMRALLIMQRLHEDDPVARLLKDEPEDWHTIYFDAIRDDRMPNRHRLDRREPGEPLCPERGQTVESLRKDRYALGSDTFNAQYQQMPASAGGMIVKPEWFQRWRDEEEYLDSPITLISWDSAFKGESTSSWVVGSVWKITAPSDPEKRKFMLVDLVRDHLDYVSTKAAIERLSLRWPETDHVIIEDKANGPALISELQHKIPNIVAFNPNPYGSKSQRLRSIASTIEQGKVWVPNRASWLDEYVNELTRFPKTKDDDQVDSTTQAIIGAIHHLEEWTQTTRGREVTFFTMGG